ncbi:hypothetical protein P691DRAFT_798564 [Macrolepiota fuliginosa MF-IS2]|uniref:SH3 domain-containing protein n=1 Tax=Macrolepiota fuliginosa MF-IS2 TaxID=1400762 RepID=A0A9P6C2Z8_9AGAR|nr:hypothetical protein P691DRAFT_798564 [Macrolepiota fuliginosa MF-IS2]
MHQVRAQQSATSLARNAPPRVNGADPFNGYESRDFCNAFWGSGDAGPNVLFARMRGAERTTDELRNFWHERTNIEEEYAQKLAKLAKVPIGVEEVGELRTSLNILRKESEVQAASHLDLANRMRNLLEKQTADFHMKQVNHRRTLQANVEKKLKHRQTQETFALKAREKYEGDRARINAYTQQLDYMTGVDAQRVEQKLARTRETAKANEKDFLAFTQTLSELLAEWQTEWRNFCDACHDIEEDRMDFMKDNLWLYANEVSTLCVSDDQSCERIREALDQFEPERDVLSFAEEYGSGNDLPQPPSISSDPNDPSSASRTQYADFPRGSHRTPRAYSFDGYALGHQPEPTNTATQPNGATGTAAESIITHSPEITPAVPKPDPQPVIAPVVNTTPRTATTTAASASTSSPSIGSTANVNTSPIVPPLAPSIPASSPPPVVPQPQPGGSIMRGPSVRSPSLPTPNGQQSTEMPAHERKVLFYGTFALSLIKIGANCAYALVLVWLVRALYDYQATIEEEFDFQAGDIIAVTAAPEDGWWSGELLDEARKVEGKHIFPSNFVCLF